MASTAPEYWAEQALLHAQLADYAAQVARFWARVEQTAGPDQCWPWRGPRDPKGYGQVSVMRITRSSRVAWTLTNGPIPDGMVVRHTCDNPPCCNPLHLRVGTHLDNADDRRIRGRMGDQSGEQNPHSKLTETLVRAIRLRYAAGGETRKSLGVAFEVSTSTIDDVLTRRTWTHLD